MNQSFAEKLKNLDSFIVSIIEEKNKLVYDNILLGVITIPETNKAFNELKENKKYMQI